MTLVCIRINPEAPSGMPHTCACMGQQEHEESKKIVHSILRSQESSRLFLLSKFVCSRKRERENHLKWELSILSPLITPNPRRWLFLRSNGLFLDISVRSTSPPSTCRRGSSRSPARPAATCFCPPSLMCDWHYLRISWLARSVNGRISVFVSTWRTHQGTKTRSKASVLHCSG